MLELRVISGTQAVPLSYLPSLMGRRSARTEIGDQIESLIAFMDVLDGDPDLEDATDLEDDFHLTEGAKESWLSDGPGCPVSDSGGCEHDGCEPSWSEASSMGGKPNAGPSPFDDEEEDDPSGQCDEDGVNTAFDNVRYQEGSSGAGCIISDPDRGADDDGEGVDDDTEPNGDEQDTGNCEDEILAGGASSYRNGPGCPVSDPGGGTEGEY